MREVPNVLSHERDDPADSYIAARGNRPKRCFIPGMENHVSRPFVNSDRRSITLPATINTLWAV
jgi:hypothetical protein